MQPATWLVFRLNQTVWLKEENMCVCVHVPMGILTFHRSFQARARLINLSLRNRAMNWIEITLLFWLAWFVKIYLKPFRLVSTRSSDCFLTRVTWYAAGCFLCCWLLVVPLAVIVLLATWWLVPAVGLLLQECQLYIFRCLRLLSMLFRCLCKFKWTYHLSLTWPETLSSTDCYGKCKD